MPLSSLPEGDGALQTRTSGPKTPAPDQNFEGINNLCGCYPPDTNGAVGQNHYVQVVNASFAAWTKTGTQVVPPTTINTLFPGTPHCGTLNRGDPVVVYDQFAQRWVISQFAFTGSGTTPPYWECTAVSTTSDPTGSWCGYEFEVHQTKFNDYPKIGVWPSQHAFTMTANQFLLGASYARCRHLGVRARRDAELPDRALRVPGHGGDRPVLPGDASGRRRRRHAASGRRSSTVRLDQPGRFGPPAGSDPDHERDGRLGRRPRR